MVLRETLAFHSPLADFAFAMQYLSSGATTLAVPPAQQAAYLRAVARNEKIAAFALTEADAGSDAGAMRTAVQALPNGRVLNGSKTWTSNGSIPDFYVTFAKSEPDADTRGMAAFIVDADTAWLAGEQPAHRGDGTAPAGHRGVRPLPAAARRTARRIERRHQTGAAQGMVRRTLLRPSHLPSNVPCLVSAWPTSC